MAALWDKGYVLASRDHVEAAIDLGGRVCPPMTLKDLLGENKNTYIKMAKLKGKGARYVMCGCLAKSNSLPLACIDDLQLGDCRLEGYRDKPEGVGQIALKKRNHKGRVLCGNRYI